MPALPHRAASVGSCDRTLQVSQVLSPLLQRQIKNKGRGLVLYSPGKVHNPLLNFTDQCVCRFQNSETQHGGNQVVSNQYSPSVGQLGTWHTSSTPSSSQFLVLRPAVTKKYC